MMGYGCYAKLRPGSAREADLAGIERKVYCADLAFRIYFATAPSFIKVIPSGSKDANPELIVEEPDATTAYLLTVGSDHPYWWLAGWTWGSMISGLMRRTDLMPIHLLQRIATERQ